MGPVLTRRTAWLLVGALAFVAMGAAVFVLPRYMVEDRKLDSDEKRLKAESDIRGSLVQAVGGLAVLAGLYFTASTLQLTRRGQLADRFSRAIGHLGEDQAAVRIGAVHELRLLVAEESGYHWRVVDVLVGFVRDRAPWPPGGSTINDRSKRVIVGFAFWGGPSAGPTRHSKTHRPIP